MKDIIQITITTVQAIGLICRMLVLSGRKIAERTIKAATAIPNASGFSVPLRD